MPTYDVYESETPQEGPHHGRRDAERAVGEAIVAGRAIRRAWQSAPAGRGVVRVLRAWWWGTWQKSDNVAVIARDGVLRGPAQLTGSRGLPRRGGHLPDADALAENGLARANVAQHAATYRFSIG
jgi:hypothetical protein